MFVVDTGIRKTHTEFAPSRVKTGYNFVESNSNTDNCGTTGTGHGTHVAGTIAGTTFGVAKQASIVPLRVLGCTGSGFWSDVIRALSG